MGEDGEQYLQLVTFGSDERQNVGTGSQNIRMDEARAAQLIDIILQAFPGIEARPRLVGDVPPHSLAPCEGA